MFYYIYIYPKMQMNTDEFFIRPMFNLDDENKNRRKRILRPSQNTHPLTETPPILRDLPNQTRPETSIELNPTNLKSTNPPVEAKNSTNTYIKFFRENKVTIIISIIVFLCLLFLVIWIFSKEDKKTNTKTENNFKKLEPNNTQLKNENLVPKQINVSNNINPEVQPLKPEFQNKQHNQLVNTIDDNELNKYMNITDDKKSEIKDTPNIQKINSVNLTKPITMTESVLTVENNIEPKNENKENIKNEPVSILKSTDEKTENSTNIDKSEKKVTFEHNVFESESEDLE